MDFPTAVVVLFIIIVTTILIDSVGASAKIYSLGYKRGSKNADVLMEIAKRYKENAEKCLSIAQEYSVREEKYIEIIKDYKELFGRISSIIEREKGGEE